MYIFIVYLFQMYAWKTLSKKNQHHQIGGVKILILFHSQSLFGWVRFLFVSVFFLKQNTNGGELSISLKWVLTVLKAPHVPKLCNQLTSATGAFSFGKVVITATKVHYEASTYNAHLRHLPWKSDLGVGGWGKHLQDEVPGAREDDNRAWLGGFIV